MRYGGVVLGVVMVLVGVMPALAADDDPRWLFSSSVNYSIGDYGTSKDTTIVYVPFTFGVRPIDTLWISATVPWIYQNSQNVVVTGGGIATRKNAKGKFAQRSEEHTSELQSLRHLVCRLLLEKKKNT